ncbi:hypothetical protein CYMTET_45232 [Cymbomonas tetramitiformis]|uniref:EamA domain-containing protein n=1 Tax=Cymbomonas tetramitiformis TaxID=36881 RepID=A0AAE0C0P7_9CHLO|nr:hypothetical protein CYMTET_45232 [Cymbomonas tetramitiformis]
MTSSFRDPRATFRNVSAVTSVNVEGPTASFFARCPSLRARKQILRRGTSQTRHNQAQSSHRPLHTGYLKCAKPSRASLGANRLKAVTDEITRNPSVESEDVDEKHSEAVVCARGICVLADEDFAEPPSELCTVDFETETLVCEPNPEAESNSMFSVDFLWPRGLLLACSVLYGTNFPLGKLMNEGLPASSATSARMLLAAVALSPFLPKLSPEIRNQAILCGCFTSLGYITQSLALIDTPASTVSFLGALTVLVCPALEAVINNRPLGLRDAPQVWLAAVLALVGVGFLELSGVDGAAGGPGIGDFYSVLQAVGFGTSFFLTEKMMAKNPTQALPITAMQVGVCAVLAGIWAVGDTVLLRPGTEMFAIPSTVLDVFGPDAAARNVGIAVLWTGLITTAANRLGETTALGKVTSAEASVLLATEPLWAAVFAALFLGEVIGTSDIVGGALMIAACLANSLKPEQLNAFIPGSSEK